MPALFEDREEAGLALARALTRASGWRSPAGEEEPLLVLGLPRGGVPVAAPVARALKAPLDVLVVRKIGAPGQEELAVGALASGGAEYLNRQLLRALAVDPAALERIRKREAAELARRERTYRGSAPPLNVRGKHVVVVDDGVATGATMLVALRALRAAGAARVTAAVPLAAREAAAMLKREADSVVCLNSPERFGSVGRWYGTFAPVEDAEVKALLGLFESGDARL